jgi:hypothetical protein
MTPLSVGKIILTLTNQRSIKMRKHIDFKGFKIKFLIKRRFARENEGLVANHVIALD